ncbi:hypothetical protein [Parafrankia sp. EUN1f]|uniref:hypothetical protein n=1 Tax=Parafrankia sp. EUN1f TaxID=102897 RepID=UPI0001C46D1B|nr:hypothetical protein [Parafrankia sp. EUN1f]EFC80073.1 hypothetical protein FrEUN1fDRAFT_6800 [Parafrankia sp. EUN1f]
MEIISGELLDRMAKVAAAVVAEIGPVDDVTFTPRSAQYADYIGAEAEICFRPAGDADLRVTTALAAIRPDTEVRFHVINDVKVHISVRSILARTEIRIATTVTVDEFAAAIAPTPAPELIAA